MKQYTRYVGMDTHKDSISIAVAQEGRGDTLYLGSIDNDEVAVGRWLRR